MTSPKSNSSRRKAKYWALVFVVLVVGIAAYYQFSDTDARASTYIDPADGAMVDLGRKVYVAQCASCHGAELEGQPDWRTRLPNGRLPAPPHDVNGHTWHHPDAVLFDIVKNGLVPGVTAPAGYQSDMPAYRDLLSDEEIRASLAYIKSRWPKKAQEIQRKMTEQATQ